MGPIVLYTACLASCIIRSVQAHVPMSYLYTTITCHVYISTSKLYADFDLDERISNSNLFLRSPVICLCVMLTESSGHANHCWFVDLYTAENQQWCCLVILILNSNKLKSRIHTEDDKEEAVFKQCSIFHDNNGRDRSRKMSRTPLSRRRRWGRARSFSTVHTAAVV